jgi:tetratricopeptide (TPR) repeat protein
MAGNGTGEAGSGAGTGGPDEVKPEGAPVGDPLRDTLDSFGDFADKAARQFGDFVDKARVKAGPTVERAAEETKRVAVDLGKGWDEAFATIRTQAKDLMAKGQHTKVRIKFREKVLAELPIAAVAAAEVASWAAFGPFRLVIGHLVGRAVLDVEFISNADNHVTEGRAWLADGEMEKALAAFDKALSIDRKSAGAYLGRGLALKLRGDKAGAKESFAKAEECDPHGEAGREARRHLDNLGI